MLQKKTDYNPVAYLGIIALFGSFFVFLIVETLNRKMPDEIDELIMNNNSEIISKKNSKFKKKWVGNEKCQSLLFNQNRPSEKKDISA